MSKSECIQIVIATIIVVIVIMNLPGFFINNRNAGIGHEFYKIVEAEGINWEEMNETEQAPYLARCKTAGLKYALFMALGTHIAFCLLILITTGLISKSLPKTTKTYLCISFFIVWTFGMIFMAIGNGYINDIQFPQSLVSVFLVYVIAGIFFISIIKIVNYFRKWKAKKLKT